MFTLFTLMFVLLVCSAFFSGSETALFSLSRVQLHKLRESKIRSSRYLVSALKKPRETIVTILLGNELVNISISIVGAALISKLLSSSVETETFLAVILVTPIVLMFGEIIPKSLSFKYADVFSQIMIGPLRIFYYIVSPLRIVLTSLADGIVKIVGGSTGGDDDMVMEDEYRRLVDMGKREGTIEAEEHELIHNVFEFTDKVVSDIMTPFDQAFVLNVSLSFEKVVEEIRCTQFSRVPFCENEKMNIIGTLHVRDLISLYKMKKSELKVDIRHELKEPIFIKPTTPLESLLKEFQRTHVHMAFVRGEDGEIKGLVTMDDVLEELFGEIED